MKKVIAEIKKYSIILIAVSAVLGVLLIAFPENMLSYTALILGAAFIVCGVFAIVNYIVKKNFVFTLTLGIIAVIAGVIICCAYKQIVTVMVFLLGIYMLVGGIANLVDSFVVSSIFKGSWFITSLLAVASAALGVVCITNPFDAQNTLVRFIGAGLIVFAVTELIAYIQVREMARKVKQAAEDVENAEGAVEVDYKEVNDN